MAEELKEIFQDIGGFGPYQFFISALAISSMIASSFTALNVVFQVGVSDHWCAVPALDRLNVSVDLVKAASIPTDGTGGYKQCVMYDYDFTTWTADDVLYYAAEYNHTDRPVLPCSFGWNYDLSVYGYTAATKWNLVCDKIWWQSTAESLYALGMLTAAPIFGYLSDKIGRRKVLAWTILPFLVVNFLTAFSPTYYIYAILRFLCGFFVTQMYIATFILAAETIGARWRPHVNSCYGYTWSAAGIILAGLAYLLANWFILQLVLSFIMLYTLLFFMMPESPRWLYVQNKTDAAKGIFYRIAKSNNKKVEDLRLCIDLSGSHQNEKVNCFDLFRTKRLALRSTVIFSNWFTVSLCYYGLIFNSTNLGGNIYLSFIISMAVEVPGNILGHLATVYIGRKWPLVFGMTSSGLLLLLSILTQQGSFVRIGFVSVGKMTATMSFNLLFVYTAELYPTVIRSMACCGGNFSSRVGSVLAPFIAQLSDLWLSLPMLIFGACSLLTGVAAVVLPETKDTFMADSLERSVDASAELASVHCEEKTKPAKNILTVEAKL